MKIYSTKGTEMFKRIMKVVTLTLGLACLATSAQAGVLTAGDADIDLSDITIVFGALIAFGVVFYGMKKSKSFIGA